jgi:hypothetical protein
MLEAPPLASTLTDVLAIVGAATGVLGAVTGSIALWLQYWRGRPGFKLTYTELPASLRIVNGPLPSTILDLGFTTKRNRRWAVRGDTWDLARSGGASLGGPYRLSPGEIKVYSLQKFVDRLQADGEGSRDQVRPYARDGRTNKIVWAKMEPLRSGWSVAAEPVPHRPWDPNS